MRSAAVSRRALVTPMRLVIVTFCLLLVYYVSVTLRMSGVGRDVVVMDAETFGLMEGRRACISGHVTGMAPVCGGDGCLRALDVPPMRTPKPRDVDAKKIALIPGWLQTGLHINLTTALTDMQWRHGVYGTVGEIGVYMGKYSSVLLHNIDVSAGERFFAADIFEKQTKVSKELGRIDIYLKYMKMWGFSPDSTDPKYRLYLWSDSSIFLSKAVFLRWNIPTVRFLSIDGGHIRPIVTNDFAKAACFMREGGIIAFDDALNSAHPGVREGIQDFFDLYGGVFRPLVIIGNKMFACTASHHATYTEYVHKHLAERFNLREIEDTLFVGNSSLFRPSAPIGKKNRN